ncbi:PAS domain S-box protein [bacterium]|nr:PAS domain S-box protein [bacterium]
MNAYSIPTFVMVIVTLFVGVYHLLLYFRRYKLYHEDLTFAISCFGMALYGVYCVGMYNANSLQQGIPFQRGQVVMLTLNGTTFLWFVVDYLNVKEKIIRNFFSRFFIISALYVLLDRSHWTFQMDKPAIKSIVLPWGNNIVYYEVEPGIAIELLSFMGVMVFVYMFYMTIHELRFGDKRKAKNMIGAGLIFCIGLINDASVHQGYYQFLYMIEYGYMGIVILMTASLTNEVVESALRKKALEESEKKYRELVDNSLVGICIIQDHLIRFCNQRFAEIFGYNNRFDVLGTPWSLFIFPDERNFIVNEISQAQIRESDHKQLEFRGVQNNGTVVDIQSFFGYILLDNLPAIQGTLIDITARKAAEKQLKQSSEQLKHYTLELEQFVNVTSHHLQEPLRSVSSYVQLLARRYKNKLDQRAHEYIQFAVEGADRMHRLINDFLVYTRVGKIWQTRQQISLKVIIQRVIVSLHESVSENGADIHIGHLPQVFGEEAKLELLFKNLILNALAYRRSDPVRIHIFSDQNDENWRIGVQDNGIGIAREYHQLIFGIFQKLNKNKKDTGTGIGLPICKKIVEQHHGQIWVASEIGKGTTVYFTLKKENEYSSLSYETIYHETEDQIQ